MALTQVDQGLLGTYAQYTGFKNRLINGQMAIDQRNAGGVLNPTNAANAYAVDRFLVYNSTASSKLSVQQSSTAPTGFKNSVVVTSSSSYSVGATDQFYFGQLIEGFNTADLAFGSSSASTVTLSFWVRSSLTGTFGGSLMNSAYNRSYPFSYTISSANTFEYKTVTIAGDQSGTWIGATNGTGLRVYFGLGIGSTYSGTANAWAGAEYYAPTGSTSVVGTSGATWYVSGVQLEKGSTATSFDYRPYGTELALCQRYYEKTFDTSVAPAQGSNDYNGVLIAMSQVNPSEPATRWTFKVEKRITGCTVTLFQPQTGGTSGQWTDSGGGYSANARAIHIGTSSCHIDNTDTNITGAGNKTYYIHATASAEL